jgi:predicted HicB family RNase H-like nuclease
LKTVTLRLPNSIHSELMAEAKSEGISLNQLCLAKMAKPLAWYADLAEEIKEERR